MVIVLDQVPKLLGLHIEKAGFFRDVVSLAYFADPADPPIDANRELIAT